MTFSILMCENSCSIGLLASKQTSSAMSCLVGWYGGFEWGYLFWHNATWIHWDSQKTSFQSNLGKSWIRICCAGDICWVCWSWSYQEIEIVEILLHVLPKSPETLCILEYLGKAMDFWFPLGKVVTFPETNNACHQTIKQIKPGPCQETFQGQFHGKFRRMSYIGNPFQ